MKIEIVPGAAFAYGVRTVEIDGPDTFTHAWAVDTATGERLRVDHAGLRPLARDRQPKKSPGEIPLEEWQRCRDLARDLHSFLGSTMPEAQVLAIAEKHSVSASTVRRARARYEQHQQSSALLRDRGGRKPGSSFLRPDVQKVVVEGLEKHYLKREHPSQRYVIEQIRSLCRRHGLPEPSPNAILRRIHALDPFDADARRLGRKAAKQKWEARPTNMSVERPLQLVEIDHTRVDVMVVSDDRQDTIGRPWITLAIDVCTRVVLGMYLTMDAPSSTSVSLCIEHMVLPKQLDRDQPGYWPMYGKPERIRVDNGKDLSSMALIRGCEEWLINLEWRQVKTPHHGAHIERLNGTLMNMCHLLQGTTFSNHKARGDYNPEDKAEMTLAELRDWLNEKICRFYHVKDHSALGVPPLVAWRHGFTDERGRLKPPSIVSDPIQFRICFLPFETRRVHRTGVLFNNSRYWHEGLRKLIRKKDTLVWYDPRSPEHVWVRGASGEFLELNVVAGAAFKDRVVYPKPDAAMRAELNQAKDKHFARCEEIEAHAHKETRSVRRLAGKSTKQTKVRAQARAKSRNPTRVASEPDLKLVHAQPLSAEDWKERRHP